MFLGIVFKETFGKLFEAKVMLTTKIILSTPAESFEVGRPWFFSIIVWWLPKFLLRRLPSEPGFLWQLFVDTENQIQCPP